jgi:hypothetical protein
METHFREKNGFHKWLWVSIKGLWLGSVPGQKSTFKLISLLTNGDKSLVHNF